MVFYQCDRCLKSFVHKGNYETHLNRKHPCKIFVEKIENNQHRDAPSKNRDEEMNVNECKFCFKIYKQKQHLYRHLKSCRIKEREDIKKELYSLLIKQNDEHKKENLFLKQQINILQSQYKKIDHNNINCNNNTINSNNINNINILAYNKTDISHITDKDFEQIMNRCNMCVPKLIEKTHYDPNKPENKNIFISNIKDKYVMMWNSKKWNLRNRDDTVDDLYENSSNILEDRIETWEYNKFQYDPIAVRKFYKFLDNKDKDQVKNKIKEEIKLILYNNRERL
tara:strand:- start:1919 stop:2764 length:846 start_codon:yes stop_codon:yes gene_type:complete